MFSELHKHCHIASVIQHQVQIILHFLVLFIPLLEQLLDILHSHITRNGFSDFHQIKKNGIYMRILEKNWKKKNKMFLKNHKKQAYQYGDQYGQYGMHPDDHVTSSPVQKYKN